MTLQQRAAIWAVLLLKFAPTMPATRDKEARDIATLLTEMAQRITDLERLTNGKAD